MKCTYTMVGVSNISNSIIFDSKISVIETKKLEELHKPSLPFQPEELHEPTLRFLLLPHMEKG